MEERDSILNESLVIGLMLKVKANITMSHFTYYSR